MQSYSDPREMCPRVLWGVRVNGKIQDPLCWRRITSHRASWGERHRCCIDPADKHWMAESSNKCQVPQTEMARQPEMKLRPRRVCRTVPCTVPFYQLFTNFFISSAEMWFHEKPLSLYCLIQNLLAIIVFKATFWTVCTKRKLLLLKLLVTCLILWIL